MSEFDDTEDGMWLNIQAVVLAVRDLQRRERHLTLLEDLMLRDAAQAIEEMRLDDILRRMRRRFEGDAEAASLPMDLHTPS